MQAYIDSLFDYARNEKDEVDTSKPSRETMHSASRSAFGLRHMMHQGDLYGNVGALIERRHGLQHPN